MWTTGEESGLSSRNGQNIFSRTSRPALGSTQAPMQLVPGLFSWGKSVEA
jgi:hypothetical protein